MKKILFLLFLAGCATAPPVEDIRYVSAGTVADSCRLLTRKPVPDDWGGCAQVTSNNVCVIYLSRDEPVCLLEHERKHCWAGNWHGNKPEGC